MKFGIFCIFDYWPEVKTVPQYFADFLELVERADELGFDSAWISEHHFTRYGGILPRPQILLAAMAERTQTIRLGTAVSLIPFDKPLRLAEDFALVDVLSGGRLEFGAGRGLFAFEYGGMQVSVDESRERLEEGVEVILKAWQEERLTFKGKFTQVNNLEILPHPLQKPHPPLYVAALSPESYEWAARKGYSILQVPYSLPLEVTKKGIAEYRTKLGQYGHNVSDKKVVVLFPTYVGETARKAKEEAEKPMMNYIDLVSGLISQTGKSEQYKHYAEFGSVVKSLTYDILYSERPTVIGDPDQVIERIEYMDRGLGGMDQFFYFLNFGGMEHQLALRSLERFGKYVLPHFRRKASTGERVAAAS
jgi:natural product biosynthesis luciferase-like monooxygenase protein